MDALEHTPLWGDTRDRVVTILSAHIISCFLFLPSPTNGRGDAATGSHQEVGTHPLRCCADRATLGCDARAFRIDFLLQCCARSVIAARLALSLHAVLRIATQGDRNLSTTTLIGDFHDRLHAVQGERLPFKRLLVANRFAA